MRRLLVIDDDPVISQLLMTIFGNEGFEVSVVDDGERGVANAIADDVDIVIAAMELPKLRTVKWERGLSGHGHDPWSQRRARLASCIYTSAPIAGHRPRYHKLSRQTMSAVDANALGDQTRYAL
jgi:hypothetical protein